MLTFLLCALLAVSQPAKTTKPTGNPGTTLDHGVTP
jgi:hypothetical protein